MTLISQQATLLASNEAFKKQAESASEAAKKYMEENDQLKKVSLAFPTPPRDILHGPQQLPLAYQAGKRATLLLSEKRRSWVEGRRGWVLEGSGGRDGKGGALAALLPLPAVHPGQTLP